MTDQKNKKIAALLCGALILGGGFFSLMAEPSTAQTPVFFYSLVPTLLMHNLVTPLEISKEPAPDLIHIASEITILRLSARD